MSSKLHFSCGTYYFCCEDGPFKGPHVTFQSIQAVGTGVGRSRVSHFCKNEFALPKVGRTRVLKSAQRTSFESHKESQRCSSSGRPGLLLTMSQPLRWKVTVKVTWKLCHTHQLRRSFVFWREEGGDGWALAFTFSGEQRSRPKSEKRFLFELVNTLTELNGRTEFNEYFQSQ